MSLRRLWSVSTERDAVPLSPSKGQIGQVSVLRMGTGLGTQAFWPVLSKH
jgi:hypothetical protein